MIEAIRRNTTAEVHDDEAHRKVYSVDASIYEIKPLAIAIPKTKDDLLWILKIAREEKIPVIPRGAATGITGGCLGKGLIIDLSKYLNHILEINIEEGFARCEPGVVQDRLNDALKHFGYRLGPDTSTGNRATLGGMLANNSAGARSLFFGCMADHVREVEIALFGGGTIKFGPLSEELWNAKCMLDNHEGIIYRMADTIRKEYAADILEHFPLIPRRVSGYNLNTLLDFPLNLSKLIAGSEGSFGIATEIKVDIVPVLQKTGLCIIPFDDIVTGLKLVPELLKHRPVALEMIDDKILDAARLSPAVQSKLNWLKGTPKMVLVVESENPDVFSTLANESLVITDKDDMQHVWDVRKAGLGLLLSKRTFARAIAFIEDISLPPERLAHFMPTFLAYLKSKGKEAGIYGHAGSGCLHIRPYVDLRDPKEALLMKEMLSDVALMVLKEGGALSGEHGDGLVRSWLNERMFGPRVYEAFVKMKLAFDPDNLMNPGKVVNGQPFLDNLRTQGEPVKMPTFLDFSKEGGIELAADLCNGNGACRKKEGIMCPSFQATEDEFDTTRARAQTLRAVITGRSKIDNDIQEALDLCLECKGCKRECPSQVDMAKMKAEMLYQHQEKHGYSIRSRLFGRIGRLMQLGSTWPTLFNWLGSLSFFKRAIGITTKRELPQLAKERFSNWFNNYVQPDHTQTVALFNDTFTEFNFPEIGIAAIKVLNAIGYKVELLPWHCCGRPMISKGLLKEAKEHALKVASMLKGHSTVISLEPSCASALSDDYQGLIGETFRTYAFDEFLLLNLPLPLKEVNQEILVHGHCHKKALHGMDTTMFVLRSLPGATIKEIPSGCCGVAGSFGYEEEHYDLSVKIGNLVLIPTIKNSPPDSPIIADGASCRSQIEHGTKRRALHLAELIASLIKAPSF